MKSGQEYGIMFLRETLYSLLIYKIWARDQKEEIRMIYVTGDCHGNFARFEQKNFPEQANMTKDDTVIITGDYTE